MYVIRIKTDNHCNKTRSAAEWGVCVPKGTGTARPPYCLYYYKGYSIACEACRH